MEVSILGDDRYADVFYELTDVETTKQGGFYIHRGTHPTHGDTIMVIGGGEAAVLIADGIRFL